MAEAPRSLRRTLVIQLLPVLTVATLVCCVAAFRLADHFALGVLDQWLLDSAMSLAKQVRTTHGKPAVDVNPEALAIFEWDAVDRIYYQVAGPDGVLLANARIPGPDAPEALGLQPSFYDTSVEGDPVRAVSAPVATEGGVVYVRVAETLRKRGGLTSDVLLSTLLFAVFIVAVVGILVWRGVGSGIAILEGSVRDVRAAHAAAPLSAVDLQSVPHEVAPLVAELNSLVEDLSAALREKQRFVADAAHQLRTPLSTLRLQFELARRETDPVKHQAAIDAALGVIENTTRVLHQLLTLARVDESAAGLPADQRVDLAALVREEVERRSDAVWQRGGDIGYEGPVEGVYVTGNAALLREALANLLDNAEKHAEGSPITAGVASAPAEIFVEDNGPGIPEAERDKVRNRFYRVPGCSSAGCGLGLAIVDGIAQRHAASLLLESGRHGRGLMARVVFGPQCANPEAGLSTRNAGVHRQS